MNFYDNLKKICAKRGLKVTPTVLESGGTKGVISGWKKEKGHSTKESRKTVEV